jgi:hypothetical protein
MHVFMKQTANSQQPSSWKRVEGFSPPAAEELGTGTMSSDLRVVSSFPCVTQSELFDLSAAAWESAILS